MTEIREEELIIVCGGKDQELGKIIKGDYVYWRGHEDIGKGLVILTTDTGAYVEFISKETGETYGMILFLRWLYKA